MCRNLTHKKEATMRSKNVCKFTTRNTAENLVCSCFVLETDKAVMESPKTLSQYRILLIAEGEGTIAIDSQTLNFCKGTLLFGFQGEQIRIAGNHECRYIYIDFSGLRAEELIKRFAISPTNRCFTKFDGIIPLWEESLLRASDNTIDLATESVVLYTFSRLTSDTSQANTVVTDILKFSEERFCDCGLSIAVIAEELGYNAKYLSHLFKEKMTISYSEYLRCLRIKYATSLFDNGIDSVKNVAFLSGFSDPLYFSTVFKKIMGMSPKDYISKNID